MSKSSTLLRLITLHMVVIVVVVIGAFTDDVAKTVDVVVAIDGEDSVSTVSGVAREEIVTGPIVMKIQGWHGT